MKTAYGMAHWAYSLNSKENTKEEETGELFW